MGLFGREESEGWEIENVRAVTGAFVVFLGIFAVVALTVVAIALLGGNNKSSVVAVTTAALGIISAVVSGYLGIKATANTAKASSEKAGEAAVAKHEARVKKQKVDRINEELDKREKAGEIEKGVANKIRAASVEAEERARETGPPPGGAAG